MTDEWMIALMQAADDFKHNQPTLRDQFAMAALQGLGIDSGQHPTYEYWAKKAYGYADAMLKAREVK